MLKREDTLAICIPIHGWSFHIEKLLTHFSSHKDVRIQRAPVFVTNSGPSVPPNNISSFKNLKIIPVASNFYWAKAVEILYKECIQLTPKAVLLMNHDCLPSKDAIELLLNEFDEHTIVHPLLVNEKNHNEVIWSGLSYRFGRSFVQQSFLDKQMCYETDAAPGQMLLMPFSAINIKYLHSNLFPHYYADHVQTYQMKKAGYRLLVNKLAIAYSNQDDVVIKEKRQHVKTLNGLFSSLFAPYSTINIKAKFFFPYFVQKTIVGAFIYSITYTSWAILKSLLGYLRNFLS